MPIVIHPHTIIKLRSWTTRDEGQRWRQAHFEVTTGDGRVTAVDQAMFHQLHQAVDELPGRMARVVEMINGITWQVCSAEGGR